MRPISKLAAATMGLAILGCGSGKDGDSASTETLYNETCDTPTTWYLDSDGDGYGAPGYPQVLCSQPPNHVTNADDCDDRDRDNGAAREYYTDLDHDGRAGTEPRFGCPGHLDESDQPHDDCNDDNHAINIFATEALNGVDDNCQNGVDDLDPFYQSQGSALVDIDDGPALVVGDLLGWGRPQVLVGTRSATHTSRVFDPLDRSQNVLTDYQALTGGVEHVVRDALDVDGDGIAELLFDTATSAGLARGPLPPSLVDPTWEWTDTGAVNSYDLVAIGDMDSDGGTWLAWAVQGSGVYLLHPEAPASVDLTGSTADLSPSTTSVGNGLGASMDGGGDSDGDGVPELLIGDPLAGAANQGQAYLITARPTGGIAADLAAATVFDGDAADERAGTVVAFIGDPNGDGYDDVVIVAQGSTSTYLFEGPLPAATTLASATGVLTGMIPNDVQSIGDLDGDGFTDLAVHGIPDGWRMVQGPITGTSSILGWPTFWDTGGDHPGSLRPLADTNGDGSDEVVLSAVDRPWPQSHVYLIDDWNWP